MRVRRGRRSPAEQSDGVRAAGRAFCGRVNVLV